MCSKNNRQIAIDGPAASGKSTVSKLIACKTGGLYVNTGNLYRALTWLALNEHADPEDRPDGITALLDRHTFSFRQIEGQANELYLFIDDNPVDKKKIRSPAVTEKVSFTAKISEVRKRMIALQRDVRSQGLIVMEGRDIGTVIFPDAKYKFFITASSAERARRRLRQSTEVYNQTTFEELTQEIEKRDRIDSTRKVAPLKSAADAFVIDTTGLSIDQVVGKIATLIKEIP